MVGIGIVYEICDTSQVVAPAPLAVPCIGETFMPPAFEEQDRIHIIPVSGFLLH